MISGSFRTPSPKGMRFEFKIAAAGCATTGSESSVFRFLKREEPILFLHLGDLHYEDIGADDVEMRLMAVDMVMDRSVKSELFGLVGLVYMWDDHDYTGNTLGGGGGGGMQGYVEG